MSQRAQRARELALVVMAPACEVKGGSGREPLDFLQIGGEPSGAPSGGQAEQAAIDVIDGFTDGTFREEIAPLTVKTRKGDVVADTDEEPGKVNLEKIPGLRAAFGKEGVLTAASSSKISDGAAAAVLMSAAEAANRGLQPLARIVAHATHAQAPEWFTTAPIQAIEKVLEKAGWTVQDVDLFEINEAFAMVPMLAMQQLSLDHARVNIHGGACALGHPVGASGTRIIVTLMYALRKLGKTRGVASLCIGGGEAVAVAIEMV